MNKGYVILEVGYEYNDEVYSTGNYGEQFEAPNEVYTDKDKAKAEMSVRANKQLRGLSLAHYGYGLDEITNDEQELITFFKDEFNIEVDDEDFYDMDVPSSATDEQLEKLQGLLTLKFFRLKEVELV
jgi:hypothetical protein